MIFLIFLSYRKLLGGLLFALIPLFWLEGVRLAGGADFSWNGAIGRWIFVILLLVVAGLSQPHSTDHVHWFWHWRAVTLGGIGLLAWIVYALNGDTSAAWIALATLYIFLIGLARILSDNRGILARWVVYGLVALAAGFVPIVVAQIESHFAEEEFFVALQAFALSGFWLVLLAVWNWLSRAAPPQARRGIGFNRHWLGVSLLLFAFVGSVLTVLAYQHSFYPPEAPGYDGISTTTPFLCGQIAPDTQTFDGKDVFRRLLARVEANPHKGVPELGMLALGSGEPRWAQAFRDSLLTEAGQGLFAGPANSIKSAQYEAALRAYYYPRVRTAFPGLFTVVEEERLRQWFASINRRAQTVEWIDWLYAVAFSKLPEGLYENQENGAGLLALLETEGLADPNFSTVNRDYLNRNRRGWQTRFRNTDDVLIYQPEWISNAFFQSFYTHQAASENMRLAFEWLLLQSVPDGTALQYNHPASVSLANVAYLGAQLQKDARYIWLSGRALANIESRGEYLFAQPGVESAVDLQGYSPTQGSCLIYGDSGLPNQVGPLAPDKIVFRDGWSKDSTYVLLNLRFTGWHRYKATNTLMLLYQGGPLVTEEQEGPPFSWLPTGRSLFRDKRIPRENLNGLLVESTGMSAVVYGLTGIGSPWAQDPPYYAEVEHFETGAQVDSSTVLLKDWRGWQDRRTVYFYHGGPTVVVDEAVGSPGRRVALTWHVAGNAQPLSHRIKLRDGAEPAEMLFLSTGNEKIRIESLAGQGDQLGLQVIPGDPASGRFNVVTVFLMGDWVGANVDVVSQPNGTLLQIVKGDHQITIPLMPRKDGVAR